MLIGGLLPGRIKKCLAGRVICGIGGKPSFNPLSFSVTMVEMHFFCKTSNSVLRHRYKTSDLDQIILSIFQHVENISKSAPKFKSNFRLLALDSKAVTNRPTGKLVPTFYRPRYPFIALNLFRKKKK